MKAFVTTSAWWAICANLVAQQPSGTIEGRVTLAGSPRPEAKIALELHPTIQEAHPDGLTTRRYEVGENGGLRNVLVFLRGDFGNQQSELLEKPMVLEHAKGLFQPYVSGIRAGQPLELRNTDRCTFNAVATANREFNYAFTASCSFTNAEVPIKFKCDTHPWNYAYVGVFSHPFFTTTDQDGSFKLDAVPAGRYTLEIFHPATGKTAQEVVVENQKAANVVFSVTPK
jgi:hypothetical protein